MIFAFIILIGKIISISWLITNWTNFYAEFEELFQKRKNILKLPGKILSCIKCVSFWVTIAYSQDIFLASFVALLASILDYYIIPTDIN